MKDYKRLTERDEFDNADIIGLDSHKLASGLHFDELNKLTSALNRLADLEDKIERGELVDRNEYLDCLLAAKDTSELTDKEIEFFAKHNARVRGNADAEIARLTAENTELCERLNRAAELPCKVGDTLYEPFINRIREWIVDSIYVFSLGINVNCERKDDCRWHDHFAIREKSNDFESRVYLTREAAEAKLAELKGGME